MKIAVCLKQVPDTETKVVLRADGQGIEQASIKWIINPYDEFAIEEALKQAATCGGQVTAISLGPARAKDALRTALAMGAHEALLLQTDDEVDTHSTARALAQVLKGFDLIFMGRLSIDDNEASVPQQVAEHLKIPHATVVSKFELVDENKATSGAAGRLVREAEGGVHEHWKLQLPAVVAVNKGINTPRYATLPGIMKAKKKPLAVNTEVVASVLAAPSVGTAGGAIRYVDYKLPPERPGVQMLQGTPDAQVQELVRLLGPVLG